MTKEIDFSISFFYFLKRYLKIYFIAISGYIFVLIKVYMSDWTYKNEIFIGTLIVFPLLLLSSSIVQYFRIKDLKYKFLDDSIIVIKSGQEEKFLLSEIKDISRPSTKTVEKTGVDYIKFKFQNGQKITLDNSLPGFSELNDFVVTYLKEKLDYIIRRV